MKFSKWRLAVLWKFTDKEIGEIKINSVPKNTKACVKILKQLFASGSVIIGEYSRRLRLGEYSPIITSILKHVVNQHLYPEFIAFDKSPIGDENQSF
jgi:hypothetical protein